MHTTQCTHANTYTLELLLLLLARRRTHVRYEHSHRPQAIIRAIRTRILTYLFVVSLADTQRNYRKLAHYNMNIYIDVSLPLIPILPNLPPE